MRHAVFEQDEMTLQHLTTPFQRVRRRQVPLCFPKSAVSGISVVVKATKVLSVLDWDAVRGVNGEPVRGGDLYHRP